MKNLKVQLKTSKVMLFEINCFDNNYKLNFLTADRPLIGQNDSSFCVETLNLVVHEL